MDTTDDNNRADDKSRAATVSKRIPNDLGQDLPEAQRKCDDPAVAATVLDSQRNHRSAVFIHTTVVPTRRAGRGEGDDRGRGLERVVCRGRKTWASWTCRPRSPEKKYAQVRTPPKPKPAGEPATPRGSDTKKKHRD